MGGTRGIGLMMVAGGIVLSLAACSRTSDGTIVHPVVLPKVSLAPATPRVPSWMKWKKSEPEMVVAENFPPPPRKTPVRRSKPRPPVVTSGSGNLACKNVTESGRVRVVCS
jgi:hypothetical protein